MRNDWSKIVSCKMIVSSLHFVLPFSHSFSPPPPPLVCFFVVTWGARELINKPTTFRDLDLEVEVNTFVGLCFSESSSGFFFNFNANLSLVFLWSLRLFEDSISRQLLYEI